MSRVLLVILIAVTVLMVFAWALGRLLFWLRATFPPNPPRRRRR